MHNKCTYKIKKKSRYILFFLAFFLMLNTMNTYAQSGSTMNGTISDSDGFAIIGATVKAVGSNVGTITDTDGNFSITIPDNVKFLEVTYLGMKTEQISTKQKNPVKITLLEDSQSLEEVTVIGYGTRRKIDLTGSVSSLKGEDLKDVPVASVASALTGRIAGVNVTTMDGSPDAEIQIRIRGGGSITQDNSPLFIVDGFQVSSIDDIPISEIQSVDVLKDASSTAIYGAKGSNGVLLITTKSGKSGREISFNSYVGFSDVYNMYDVMSPYEFVYYQRELGVGDDVYGLWADRDIYRSMKGNDWQDELYGNTGVKQNYNLNISGGSNDLKYTLGYTRDDDKYVMLNSRYVRDNISFKVDHNLAKNLKFNFQTRIFNTVITGPNISYKKMLRNTVKYAPVYGLNDMNDDDALGDDELETDAETLGSLSDPIYNVVNEYKKQNRFSNTYNAGISWEIIKGLTYDLKGSYAISRDYTDDIWLNKTGESRQNGGMPVAQREEYKGYSWTIQNILSYKYKTKIQRFDVMLGQEMTGKAINSMQVYSKFYPKDFTADDVLAMWNYGTSSPTYTTIGEPSRTASYFGRVNYDYMGKYYATFNLRADGTNVFAPDNRWGVFPGGALAWRISEEEFMKSTQTWMSNLKMRLSYGAAGNARVGSYWRQDYSIESRTNYQYFINNISTSSIKPGNRLKNENLTWETKYSTNLGFDFGLLKDRLNVTVDLYNDVTKDLILEVDLPYSSGFRSQYQNIGQTTNRGIELAIDGLILNKQDYSFGANFNIAFNKNKVDELNGNPEMVASSAWGVEVGSDDYRVRVGDELGLMYGYVVDGFYTEKDFTWDDNQKKWLLNEGVVDCSSVLTKSEGNFGPGHIKLRKLSGEGNAINPDEDRTIIGRAQPLFTGGFGFNGKYKGFDISASFSFSYGNDVYNANKIDYTSYAGSKKYNNLSTIMNLGNRWTVIDPETGNNIMYGKNADPEKFLEQNRNASIWSPLANTTIFTNWAVEDGSFIRFNNLTLGYTLPEKLTRKIAIKRLRIYASGNNLHCWTKYSGQDPEVNTRKSSPLTPGVDYSAYPKAHSYVFGANITF